jgi:hypothetical protein
MSSPLGKAARSSTSPFRNYFNQHFEMVKEEIRANGAQTGLDWLEPLFTDLEAGLVEQSLHHARALARVRDDLERLEDRLEGLEQAVRRLTEVLAASLVDEGGA